MNTVATAKDKDPFRPARAAFQEAYARIDSPEAARAADSQELRTYPLYPYLQAARIRRALSQAGDALGPADERAQTFLTYYADEPFARSLRAVWLASLAQRSQWQPFLEHYRPDHADAALQCMSFTARIELNRTSELERDIAKRWLTPGSLPDCERAFEWLRTRKQLTPELIEQRVRLALHNNNADFARQIAAAGTRPGNSLPGIGARETLSELGGIGDSDSPTHRRTRREQTIGSRPRIRSW